MEKVKDIMIPVREYVTVDEDMSIREAIAMLESMRRIYQTEGKEYRPRQLIVLDRENRVKGMLGQIDIVMSMEPKYQTMRRDEGIDHISASGLSPELLRSMMQSYSLWGESFETRCRKVINMKVKECMRSPTRGEYIEETESLETAIHQIVMGRHMSLLVSRGQEVVGILRLSDIFNQIALACTDKLS